MIAEEDFVTRFFAAADLSAVCFARDLAVDLLAVDFAAAAARREGAFPRVDGFVLFDLALLDLTLPDLPVPGLVVFRLDAARFGAGLRVVGFLDAALDDIALDDIALDDLALDDSALDDLALDFDEAPAADRLGAALRDAVASALTSSPFRIECQPGTPFFLAISANSLSVYDSSFCAVFKGLISGLLPSY
jgi:hypothetical protein